MVVLTKKSDLQHILDRIIPAYGKYIDVLPGWYGIILELDNQIAEIDPDYSIAQIKEKFGTLRYYVESSNNFEAIQPLVREAEDKTSRTCEKCGAPAAPPMPTTSTAASTRRAAVTIASWRR